MRTTFLLLVLTVTTFIHSQVIKTINVETAGTLSTILTEDEKSTITDLTVTGTIDARDFKCMRDQIAILKNLDLSNANIVAFNGIGTVNTTYSYPINELPKFSFYNGTTLKAKKTLSSIVLPVSLTSIGQCAFYLCESIVSINIGNSITNIGVESFKGCYGLRNILFGNSVKVIQQNAFQYCSSLRNITLSQSITTIGDDAFSDCSIEKVTFPNSLTTISNAFRSNSYLTEVTIPETVTKISNWAFQYCNSLKTIYSINTTPPVCETYSFSVVPNVTSVYVPASSVSAYKNAPVWGDSFYSQIKPTPISSVKHIENENVEIYSLNSNIIIENTSKGDKISVFTLNGQLVNTIVSLGEKIVIPALNNSAYIVKINSKITKILI